MPPSRLVEGISEDLDAVVLHSLAKPRDARYQSAGEFRADLQAVRLGRPISDAARGSAAALAGAAAGAAVAGATEALPVATIGSAELLDLPKVVPVHFNDYGVFASPLSDFVAEMRQRGMAERVPSMDVRFFVIAVVIQRATGGDLAEVLDKIGRLIRQRFELAGHVKALTAEGRLSGVVLLALPPALLAFLCVSNYPYVEVLFTTPTGSKMLAITAVLQLVGALSIKKIVAIKV